MPWDRLTFFIGTSETEVQIFSLNVLVLLWKACFKMDRIAFNVNGVGRTDELASAASYAHVRSSFRNGKTSLERNHVYGLYRTVLGTCSATGVLDIDNALVYVEYHAARLCLVLLFNRKGLDGSVRADFTADGAVVVAVALIELHDRLHYAADTIFHSCRFEYV